MNEPLFRVGACYASKGGSVMRVDSVLKYAHPTSHFFSVERLGGSVFSHDGSRHMDGSYFGDPNDEASLIPGELHLVNGEWLPVEEKAANRLTDDELEGLWDFGFKPQPLADKPTITVKRVARSIDPNAKMIARDGPARPAPVVIQEPTKPSAHAAIAGLTQLGAVDHRFGSAFR
jgi:hypothetical protein